jgi:hypothetical protein
MVATAVIPVSCCCDGLDTVFFSPLDPVTSITAQQKGTG